MKFSAGNKILKDATRERGAIHNYNEEFQFHRGINMIVYNENMPANKTNGQKPF